MSDAKSAYNRENHDGEQAISTVTGLQAELDLKLEDADMQAALSGFTRMVPVAWIGTPSVAAYPIINSAHPTITGAYYFEWNRTTDNRLLDENGLAYLSENGTILELN